MSNSFITVKEIARKALPRLAENLVMPNLCYRDISQSFAAKLGDTVQVRKPIKLTAADFSEENGTTAQPIIEESVSVKLDKIATVDVEISALDGALDIDSIDRLFIEPAAAALAAKINADGMALYKQVPYYAGEAGSAPDSLEDIASARRILNQNKVPTDRRYAVWDVEADTKLTQIPALVNAEKSGTDRTLRRGMIGNVFGIENYMTQAVCRHSSGTLSAANDSLVLSAAAENDEIIKIAASSGSAVTGTLCTGDLLKITAADGSITTHTVLEDAAASGNTITAKVYPAVTMPADSAVKLETDHTANLVFHPNAFAFVSRPLVEPSGVESYVTTFNGISLRVVKGYNMTYKKEMLSMDVLYNFVCIYPELACRYLG